MNIDLHISSRQNPIIKKSIQIANNKGYTHNYAILEGIHLCQEWLKHKGAPHQAFFSRYALECSSQLQDIASKLDKNTVYTTDKSILKSISNVAYAQGVFFIVEIPRTDMPIRINKNSLILDCIQDPGNVGTIIRSAAGAGIKNIYLTQGCANPWSLKTLRSTQGAIFSLNIFNGCNTEQLLNALDIPLIVTKLDNTAKNLYDLTIPKNVAWAFGNEGSGVDKMLSDHATHKVFIPQDIAIESLNVSSAAAICMFEQRRQTLHISAV